MSQNESIDALLVGRLYGELDDVESAELERHLEAHPEDRGALARMAEAREELHKVPALEPPAALSQRLLHEAGKRAPSTPAAGSWWERMRDFLAPLTAHPAAAAVATLVVVAGVAGALLIRGEHRVAEPRIAAAPASLESVGGGASAAGEAVVGGDLSRSAGLADEAMALELEAALEAGSDDAPSAAADRAIGKREERTEKAAVESQKPRGAPSRRAAEPQAAAMADEAAGAGRAQRERRAAARSAKPEATDSAPASGSVTSSAEAAPAAPVATSAPLYSEQAEEAGDEDASWSEAQLQALRAALTARRCVEAARIARQLRDRTPIVYRARVTAELIEPCRREILGTQRSSKQKN